MIGAAHPADKLNELLQAQLKLQAALDLLQPASVLSTPVKRCTTVMLLQGRNDIADISKNVHV